MDQDKGFNIFAALLCLGVAIIIILASMGVFAKPPVSGVIIDKIYEPERADFHAGAGKVPSFWTVDGPDWILRVQDDQGEVHELEVTVEEFNSVNIGDQYTEQPQK